MPEPDYEHEYTDGGRFKVFCDRCGEHIGWCGNIRIAIQWSHVCAAAQGTDHLRKGASDGETNDGDQAV